MFYVCIIRKGKTKWTHNISYFIITPLGEVLHNKITWLWPTALWAVQTLQLCDGHPEHGLHYALYCWDDHQTSGSETLRETRCTLSIPFQLTFYFAPVVWYAVLISICVSAFTFVLFPLSLSLSCFCYLWLGTTQHYFIDAWNSFDALIVVGSLADIMIAEFSVCNYYKTISDLWEMPMLVQI